MWKARLNIRYDEEERCLSLSLSLWWYQRISLWVNFKATICLYVIWNLNFAKKGAHAPTMVEKLLVQFQCYHFAMTQDLSYLRCCFEEQEPKA